MNIDLSFTKDPAWISARTKVWAPIEADLKSGLRKKELESLKHYFFTGVLSEGRSMNDRPKLLYFPLTTPEGWNYVFQHLARDGASLYKSEYYQSINDSLAVLSDMDVRLRYFDYFHGEQHRSTVTTPVPVSPKDEPLTFEVDAIKKFQRLCANTLSFVDDNRYELMYQRRKVFFNMFDLVAKEPKLEGSSSHRLLAWLMEHVIEFKPRANFSERELQQSFLSEFKDSVEKLEGNNAIKQLWLEVQQAGESA